MDMQLEKEREELEQEKAKMYIQYLSNIFSHPPQEKPSAKYLRAKKEFESLLTPDGKKEKARPKQYEWDFDPETLLEERKIEQ